MRAVVVCMLFACACRAPETEIVEQLAVANWYPGGNAPCVERDTSVYVTFTLPLDEASAAEALSLRLGNTAVPATLTVDAEEATVTLAPETILAFDSTYTISIEPTLKSESGAELGTRVTSMFHTIEQEGCAGNVECFIDTDCTEPDAICSVRSRCAVGCLADEDCAIGALCALCRNNACQ
jgi:hypothetical protein